MSPYTKTPVPAPPIPDTYLVQFIGGPFNANQEFHPKTKFKALYHGDFWRFAVAPEQPKIPMGRASPTYDVYDYRAVFLPLDQTPFTDCQVVIFIYQP